MTCNSTAERTRNRLVARTNHGRVRDATATATTTTTPQFDASERANDRSSAPTRAQNPARRPPLLAPGQGGEFLRRLPATVALEPPSFEILPVVVGGSA